MHAGAMAQAASRERRRDNGFRHFSQDDEAAGLYMALDDSTTDSGFPQPAGQYAWHTFGRRQVAGQRAISA